MRERLSRGEGRTVIFIHSALGDGSQWEELFELTPPGVRAIALDVPELAYNAPGATLWDIESELAAYLGQFRDAQVTLVGLSLGGWLVARMLASSPERIARAVIISGVTRLSREEADGYRALAQGIESGQVELERVIEDLVVNGLGSARTPELTVRLRTMLQRYSQERFVRALRLIAGLADEEAQVRPFSVPTTVVQAEADPLVRPAMSRSLAGLGEHATLELWPGDCHMLQWAERERLANIVFA